MPASRALLWGGLAAAAGGAVLCVLGWYGISGERFAERQLPYLASCTVPGAAMIVAGAVLVAAACRVPVRGGAGAEAGAEAGVEPGAEAGVVPEEAPPPSSPAPPVRVPGGSLAHRPDCPLVAGKEGAEPVGDARLDPCPVCEPWPP